MKHLALVLSSLALALCAPPVVRGHAQATPATRATPSKLAALTQSLMTASARDFREDLSPAPPHPERFRDVRLKSLESAHGKTSFLLCGEFMPVGPGQKAWVPFATVDTRRHGQWKGSHAADLCQRSSSVPAAGRDLSSSLQRIYDALPQPSVMHKL